MDYKEKYNAALERANVAHKDEDRHLKATLERIFPELKKSEDERIRKKVIEVLKLNIKGAESQMQASRGVDRCFEIYACNKVIVWLEKQGEQKTDDKVEPKFKVGDWIILPLGIIAHIDSLNSTDYQVTTTDGKNCDFKISKQDNYRLWSITDAKNGDLIYVSTEEKGIQAIFHEYKNDTIFFHCYLCTDFVQGGCMPIGSVSLTYPLQKTHYNRFFEKMHEAGYEWDNEKKELKKIESNTLDAAKVIEWLKTNVFDDSAYGKAMIEQFKKDCEI